jgi:hypothetical protein
MVAAADYRVYGALLLLLYTRAYIYINVQGTRECFYKFRVSTVHIYIYIYL